MKDLYPKYKKLSQNMTKYTEIDALKLKTNANNIQKGIDILNKYFYAAHALMIEKIFF